ncbi:Telomere repeat-binding factor- dimerization domain protein [Apiospora saccharicola]|uniref:Telomere repeat-binding factor- dimerization domain protein n=1 Tax=Apiospora saccharicola TaxID=335842 RepID=A0ABR1W4P5_9PEZI
MDDALEEAPRAANEEHPPDHQAILDALDAMAAAGQTTPPTSLESHHHDDELGPDIFELLKQEHPHDSEGIQYGPENDTTGAAPDPMATEPHPAPPSESRPQSTEAHEQSPATAAATTTAPDETEEPEEFHQEILDALAEIFNPSSQPLPPANSEEKNEVKRESPVEEPPPSPVKRMRSPEDDTTAEQKDAKRVKTEAEKTDADHARELAEELQRIFASGPSNPVHDDPMDAVADDEPVLPALPNEPGDHHMLDADAHIIDHLTSHFGEEETHDLTNGVLDGFHSDFVLEGLDGENTLHSEPNGTPDLTLSDTPAHKKSIWDPNPKHFTRQMHYIPTLGTVAYDVLRALSERSFETVIGGINPKENGEETEVFKEYRNLKSFFYDLREKISDEFPLLYPDQLDIVDTGEQEIIRVANLATICSSIFGANELGWPDLDSNFLLAFVPKSKPMTSEVADLYIGLKTQMYLDLLENEEDSNREPLLKRLFVDGVESSLKQRHPDVPLVGAEKDFLANCNARKALLLEESFDPAKIVELKDQKYPYDSFLQSINVYISNCIETIESLATRRNSISFDMENFSFDDGLDGHDLDLETLMAEATSRANQAMVDENEVSTNGADIDELAALLADGITRNSQQQQTHPPTAAASGLSPTALALEESALRAKTLALDSIQQNQYRPTVSPQPSSKPTTYHNPQQHQPQPQPQHAQYYQYNQQPAENAQASDKATSSTAYPRTTRSSNHARREGSHSTRRPWSADEEKALMMGLDMVKGPHWSQILSLFGPTGSMSQILADRTQVQLKDKARNLKLFFLKTNSEMPYYLQCVTGELKTRAPTQAARKEAEEKARLTSQEEQERINGIMALGNMQTNGAQRPNPALVGQRSATPNQPPQGGLQAHPNANRATQSQPATPVAGRVPTGQTAPPVRYPPTAPKPYQQQGTPSQPAAPGHPVAQPNGQRPQPPQPGGHTQTPAQNQQQQGLPQTLQQQHGLPSSSQQYSGISHGQSQGQQQQPRPGQSTLHTTKPQQHPPQYQQRPQTQSQPASQSHAQANPQQPQRVQQPVQPGVASVNPQQTPQQQRLAETRRLIGQPLGPSQPAPRATVPGQAPTQTNGQPAGQAPRPAQYTGTGQTLSRPPQPHQPSSQAHLSTQQSGQQNGIKREGLPQQPTQPALHRPVQQQPVSQQTGQPASAQQPVQARAPPQSIPSAASQAPQGTLRTPQANSQPSTQGIGQVAPRAPQTTSQQAGPQGVPRAAPQVGQGTPQATMPAIPRANPQSSAPGVPQALRQTTAQPAPSPPVRTGLQGGPQTPAQNAPRTAPPATNQQPVRTGPQNLPPAISRPAPPTASQPSSQAPRPAGPQTAAQAAASAARQPTQQALPQANAQPSLQAAPQGVPQAARPSVPQTTAHLASQAAAPRPAPQAASAAVPRALPQTQSPRPANTQQLPPAPIQAQSQAQSKTQTQPQAQPQPRPQVQTQAQGQPQPRPQVQTQAHTQVKPQQPPPPPPPAQQQQAQARPQVAQPQAAQPQQRPPPPPQQQNLQHQAQQARQPPSQLPQQQPQAQSQARPQTQPLAQPRTQSPAQPQTKPQPAHEHQLPQKPQQAPQQPPQQTAQQPRPRQQQQQTTQTASQKPSHQPPPPPPEQRPQQSQVPASVPAATEAQPRQEVKAEPAKEGEVDHLFFLKEAMEREQQDAREKEAREKEAEALRAALLAIDAGGGGGS